MEKMYRWDVERAAAWLRAYWGTGTGEAPPAAAVEAAEPLVVDEPLIDEFDDDFDIAGWPALVAPFYD